jgi:hypothetical protein
MRRPTKREVDQLAEYLLEDIFDPAFWDDGDTQPFFHLGEVGNERITRAFRALSHHFLSCGITLALLKRGGKKE